MVIFGISDLEFVIPILETLLLRLTDRVLSSLSQLTSPCKRPIIFLNHLWSVRLSVKLQHVRLFDALIIKSSHIGSRWSSSSSSSLILSLRAVLILGNIRLNGFRFFLWLRDSLVKVLRRILRFFSLGSARVLSHWSHWRLSCVWLLGWSRLRDLLFFL